MWNLLDTRLFVKGFITLRAEHLLFQTLKYPRVNFEIPYLRSLNIFLQLLHFRTDLNVK